MSLNLPLISLANPLDAFDYVTERYAKANQTSLDDFAANLKAEADCLHELNYKNSGVVGNGVLVGRKCQKLNEDYLPKVFHLDTRDETSCNQQLSEIRQRYNIPFSAFPSDICFSPKKINILRKKLKAPLIDKNRTHVSIFIPPAKQPQTSIESERITKREVRESIKQKFLKEMQENPDKFKTTSRYLENADGGAIPIDELPIYYSATSNKFHEFLYRGDICTQEVKKRTMYMMAFGFIALGAIYAAPESMSNWTDEQKNLGHVLKNYSSHVSNKPVWDKDDWAINYIGHPVAGAYYYGVARHSGCSIAKSVGYTFLMSSLFWEYGLESFFEQPSIQDLLFTWSLGSILGEIFYAIDQQIEANDNKVWGSEKLANFFKYLLNPGIYVVDAMESFGVRNVAKPEFFIRKRSQFPESTNKSQHSARSSSLSGYELGVTFRLQP